MNSILKGKVNRDKENSKQETELVGGKYLKELLSKTCKEKSKPGRTGLSKI